MRVLIVEDRPELARLIRRYLEPVACDVMVSMTREEAAGIIRATDPLDLITIDLGLPDSVTAETVKWLGEVRSMKPNAVVVVITGVVSKEDEKHVLDAGADGFIHKTEVGSQLTLLERLAQIGRSLIAQPQRFARNIEVAEAMADRFTKYLATAGQK